MEVRKVTPADDFEALGAIYAASWKAAYKGMVPQNYLDTLDGSHWASILAGGDRDVYALTDGGQYVGAASVGPARDAAMAGWGEVLSIYLLPGCFGKGYGTALLGQVMGALQAQGFTSVYLWVLEQNTRARRFYEKHGFAPNGDAAGIAIGGKELTEVRYVWHAEAGGP